MPLRIDKLNEKADFAVMANAPFVLFLGKRCLGYGYGFDGNPGAQPVLVTPNGRKITLEGYAPVLPMTAAQREAGPPGSPTVSSSTVPPPKGCSRKLPSKKLPFRSHRPRRQRPAAPDHILIRERLTLLVKDPDPVCHQLSLSLSPS